MDSGLGNPQDYLALTNKKCFAENYGALNINNGCFMIVLCCIMLKQKNADLVSDYICVDMNVIKAIYIRKVHFYW